MNDTMKTIQERHSSRGQFDSERLIKKDQLKMILEAARWAPSAHNMQNFEIIVIDDRKLIESLGKIESITSEEFIRENFDQLSMSEEELKNKKTGILGMQFPEKWRDASKLDEAVEERSPTPLAYTITGGNTILLVIYDKRKRAPASEGDFLGILSLGCVMENIWLTAQSLGISVHIMSAFESIYEELKDMLNIPEHMGYGFTLKLGYPVSERKYLRVRRDIESFTHHNRYGNKGLS